MTLAFAITLRVSGNTAAQIEKIWKRFSDFESVHSMESLNYAPHITLGIYENISEDILCNATETIYKKYAPFKLPIVRLRYFESPKFVIWVEPEHDPELVDIHRDIQDLIDPIFCYEHYRLGSWVPHITIATSIEKQNEQAAIKLASEQFKSFEIIFDKIDCVEFLPVRIIEERSL